MEITLFGMSPVFAEFRFDNSCTPAYAPKSGHPLARQVGLSRSSGPNHCSATEGMRVEYLSHPLYDRNPGAREWLYLRPDDWTELEPGPEKALQDLLRSHKPWLCELALNRIRPAAGSEYLAERPYPMLNDFLFLPLDDTGYRVYIEYFFNQRLDQASPDSDVWWAMINCPYAVEPYPTGRREAYVIGLGWWVV